MTDKTAMPQETRPIRMDPDLTGAIEKLLAPYAGAELGRAQEAVVKVHQSSVTGVFRDMVATYETAILDAV